MAEAKKPATKAAQKGQGIPDQGGVPRIRQGPQPPDLGRRGCAPAGQDRRSANGKGC